MRYNAPGAFFGNILSSSSLFLTDRSADAAAQLLGGYFQTASAPHMEMEMVVKSTSMESTHVPELA